MRRKGRIRALPAVAVFLLVVIQFVPARPTPRGEDPSRYFESSVQVSGEVGAMLRTSCYDCHGGPTRLPWYGRVAPVSWLVVRDINESMEHLDFSRWGDLTSSRQAEMLGEIAEEVQAGKMPLPIYATMHAGAKLDPARREAFRRWAEGEAARLSAHRASPGVEEDDLRGH